MLAISMQRLLANSAGTAMSLAVAMTAATWTFILATPDAAEAKAPGAKYCFYGRCHRVKTIKETQALIGKTVTLHASHYNACEKDPYNPCGLTSSGERFYPMRPDNAASPIYPDGTKLLVWNPATKGAALLRINNAGPYWGNRKLDVSVATAEKLGFRKRGVAPLKTRILGAPTRREARYSRQRRYEPVAGYLGKFESLDAAEEAVVAIDAVRALAASAFAPSSGAVVASAQAESLTAGQKRIAMADKTAPMLALVNQIDAIQPVRIATIEARDLLPTAQPKRPAPVRVASLSTATSLAGSKSAERPSAGLLAAHVGEIEVLGEPAASVELIQTADAGAFGTMSQDLQEELLIQRFRRADTGASGARRYGGGWPWPDRERQEPRGLPMWPNTARGGTLG